MIQNRILLFFGCFLLLISIQVSAQSFFKAPPGAYWVSTDLHIHTVFSDGSVWPSIRVEEARREGLDLISMTEHLEYQPHSEDIPHPDRNRSFAIANGMISSEEKLQVINGSEITRDMPPGHINAVFIKDANALLHSDSLTGIKAANKQGGFVFWNHPNWDAHRKDGIARLDEFHKYLIKNKLLHGLEVVNERTYSEEALQIALDHELTILGTSDIHGLTDWLFEIPQGGHRPMTFVLSESKSPVALKKALFEGKTVVWFKNLLIGKEVYMKQMIRENLTFGSANYLEDKTILQLELTNHSATDFQLEYTGDYSFHKHSSVITIPAESSVELMVKTKNLKSKVTLPFRILNTIIAPKTHLEMDFHLIL
jgi:hypothetical protein